MIYLVGCFSLSTWSKYIPEKCEQKNHDKNEEKRFKGNGR